MAYHNFTFDSVTERFALARDERANLFPALTPRALGQALETLLEDQVPLALAIGTEKARSELIIAPLLAEARRQSQYNVGLFSGYQFDVAPDLGLCGFCDFIFSRSPEMYSLKAPAVMIVEAKQENIPGGFGQCIAEMVAARMFNQKAGNGIETIHGAVTTGDNWRFLKLEGTKVFVDLQLYQINQVGKILGILLHILLGDRQAEAIAA